MLLCLDQPVGAEEPGLEVIISGVEGELLANVQAFLQIHQLKQSDQALPGERRLHWLHNQAQREIREALEPFGYFSPEIDASLTETETGWEANYRIDPGPAMLIAALDLQLRGAGRDDPAFQRLIADTPLAVGRQLDQREFEQLKTALQSTATERGFFEGRLLVSRLLVDLENDEARVILHYDTGERYRFGEVAFVNAAVTPDLLDRYVRFQAGDPYDAADLLAMQSGLLNSEFFDQVIIDASPTAAEDRVIPVTVELTMRKRSLYTFGLGYATDTGPRARVGLERRWVNRFGHSLQAQAFVSEIRSSLGAAYVMPGDDPRTDRDTLQLTINDENSDSREFINITGGFARQFQDGHWTKLYGLGYLWERFEIGTDSTTSHLLMPGARWSRVQADDRLRVTRGWSLTLEARAAAEPLFSSLSFIQPGVQFSWIHAFNPDNRLLLRTRAGTTVIEDSDFPDFPSSLRFYTGGDNSVRGYALDSIGPRDDQDNVVGGKHLLVGSLEYDYRLRDNWSVAAFVDAGDAFDNTPDFKIGAGFGVRWQTPVGPVRLDLAHGFDKPGDTIRIHFSIGPEL